MRLIDADAWKKDIEENYVFTWGSYMKDDVIQSIDAQPTIEAVPVEWIEAWNDKAWSNHDGMHGWFEKLIEEWRNENGKAD